MALPEFVEMVDRMSGQSIELCYHCHKCTAGCPSTTAMDYGPDRVLRMVQFEQEPRVLTSRDLWLCVQCEYCGAHCPNEIDMGSVFRALRQIAGERGYRVSDCAQLREVLATYLTQRPDAVIEDRLCEGLARLNRLGETLQASRNISGDSNDNRLLWSQNLESKPEGLEGRSGAETVYFVGCVASLFPRSYSVPQALTQVLEAAGSDFTTLGGKEWCCGYPLLAMGRLEEARELIQHNVEQVKALGAKQVTFSCPSCFHMWKHVYPEVLEGEVGLEILHATELMAQLIGAGRLQLGQVPMRVTYHDPCDLGRKGGVFDAPRAVLKSIPGIEFIELPSCANESTCCGGGGNLESFDARAVTELSARRVEEAAMVEAKALISACQQCERTLATAARANKLRIKVMDVGELVLQSLQAAAGQP